MARACIFSLILAFLLSVAVAQDAPLRASVPLTERNQWCSAQRDACTALCSAGTTTNLCSGITLTYTCRCDNGTSLDDGDLERYKGTLPNFICQEEYSNCTKSGSSAASCRACGSLALPTISSSTTSSSSRSTSTSTRTSTTAATTSSTRSTSSATGTAATRTTSGATNVPVTTGPTPTSTGGGGPSDTHVGAIVGGTLGGLALLVSILTFVWLKRTRRKKENTAQATGGKGGMARFGTFLGSRRRHYKPEDTPDGAFDKFVKSEELEGTPVSEAMDTGRRGPAELQG